MRSEMSDAPPASVLVVDDEESVRGTFRDLLESDGYRVETVASSAEARAALRRGAFDVVLTDLMLPEESGLSLLRTIHELDAEMSVVMITGHPELSTAVAALKHGAYDYLTKPVTRQALLAVVERAIERRRLLAEKRRLEEENAEYQRSLERKVRERTRRLRDSERRYRALFQETRRAYEELKSTQQRLIRSERLAAVGELAARIAHEIRNPLGAISNSIGVLRRDLRLEGDDRRLLEVVFEESQRLAGIVADFLKYARPRPIRRAPCSLVELLDDVLFLLERDERAAAGIAIERDYGPALPPVAVDPDQMREALWNLLVNAVEAMPQGGRLRVAARRGAGEPSTIEIDIVDSGKGVPREAREHLFEPFFTTKTGGTGLGLAVVQRVVEDHDGEVRLVNSGARGTTFRIRIPVSGDGHGEEIVDTDRTSLRAR